MLHIIIGPPCAGKSTYVREHAAEGDIRIDFDALASALGSASRHLHSGAVAECAFRARDEAIRYCCANADALEAWIIHTSPRDWQRAEYEKAGAEFVEMDADLDTCLARMESDGRPPETERIIRDYFENAAKAAFLLPEKEASMDKLIKAAEAASIDGGTVKGYASTFVREPDSYGDVVAKGAFAKSLERWESLAADGKSIPLLYGHNTDDPKYNIGRVVSAREDDYGLYIEAEFDAENETAQYVRKLVQEGRLYQFSFAFSVLDQGETELDDGRKANELREIDIFEVSLVQIPANQTAIVTEIKSDEPEAKSGRRNSAKDAREIERIGALASEISKAVDGLLEQAEDEPAEAGGKSEGGESREDEAAFTAAYKDAIKQLLKVR